MKQQAEVGYAEDLATRIPVTAIPPHFQETGNPFLDREEHLPPHSSWASGSEPPAPLHTNNATAGLSPWNGNLVSLGQPNACPVRDGSERTRLATPSSVPPSYTFTTSMTHQLHLYVTM